MPVVHPTNNQATKTKMRIAALSVERRFAGSDGDPTFAQSVTPSDWAHYLLAFAR
jgi:hypothetical protein